MPLSPTMSPGHHIASTFALITFAVRFMRSLTGVSRAGDADNSPIMATGTALMAAVLLSSRLFLRSRHDPKR